MGNSVHLNLVRPGNGKTSNSTSLVPPSSIHLFTHSSTYQSIHVPIHLLILLHIHASNQQLKKHLTQFHQAEGQSCLVGAQSL